MVDIVFYCFGERKSTRPLMKKGKKINGNDKTTSKNKKMQILTKADKIDIVQIAGNNREGSGDSYDQNSLHDSS